MNNGASFQISIVRFSVCRGALLTQPDTIHGLPDLETEKAKLRSATPYWRAQKEGRAGPSLSGTFADHRQAKRSVCLPSDAKDGTAGPGGAAAQPRPPNLKLQQPARSPSKTFT